MTSTQKQVTSNLAHVYVRLYVRILHNLYVNMHPYENVELLDMLLVFGEARRNAQEARRIYRERYPNRQQPSSQLFRKICRRLLETGCFYPTTGGNANRVRRTPRFEEAVLNIIEDEPSTSTRIIGNRLNVNHVSVWQVLKEQGLYPYSRQKVQALGPDDFQPRLLFCRWLLRRCNLRRHFEKFVLFTDEACFTRDGVFNSKNNHLWADENPHAPFIRAHQQRFAVNVWAGIIGEYVIGPYILPNRLNGENYFIFLDTVLPELLEDLPLNIRRRLWFQHDGAPAHTTREVTALLNRKYPNKWIGRRGPVAWPARSPDLTPLDFFFWGQMKTSVYETPVNTELELVARIVAAAEDIKEKQAVLAKVSTNIKARCRACVAANGGHFENHI